MLTSRITAVRKAVGDSGEQQNLIGTIARKGIRFVGTVSEQTSSSATATQQSPAAAAKRASYAQIFASPRKKRFHPATNMAIFALPGTT